MTVRPYKPTTLNLEGWRPSESKRLNWAEKIERAKEAREAGKTMRQTHVRPLRPPWTWWAKETMKGLMGGTLFLLAMGLLYFLILVAAEAQRTWR